MAAKMKITSAVTVFGSASLFAISLLANISPASAARFAEGTFNISGGTVDIESFGTVTEATNGQVTSDSPFTDFDFTNLDDSNPDGTGQFTVGGGTGDFSPFLADDDPPVVQSGNIMDVSNVDLLGLLSGNEIEDFLTFTFQNPGNTFDLETLGLATFDQTGVGVTISIGGEGVFDLVDQDQDGDGIAETEFLPTDGDITFGAEITFNSLTDGTTPSTPINSVDDLTAFLIESGNTIEGISWSAEASLNPDTPPEVIPESSNLVALLGLGLVGGTVIARQRKRQTN